MPDEIAIVGNGNLSTHLQAFFKSAHLPVSAVVSRSEGLDAWGRPIQTHGNLADLPAKWLFFALPDQALISLPDHFTWRADQIGVHLSGSTSMDVLPFDRRGVFYPLQTFSVTDQVDWSQIPVFLEASDSKVFDQLSRWGLGSAVVQRLTSEERARVHLLAVIVSNFPVFLWALVSEESKSLNIPFDWFEPLIQKSLNKVLNMPSMEALTGPAKRNDRVTLHKHMEDLKAIPQWRELYGQMTNAILKRFGHERLDYA